MIVPTADQTKCLDVVPGPTYPPSCYKCLTRAYNVGLSDCSGVSVQWGYDADAKTIYVANQDGKYVGRCLSRIPHDVELPEDNDPTNSQPMWAFTECGSSYLDRWDLWPVTSKTESIV